MGKVSNKQGILKGFIQGSAAYCFLCNAIVTFVLLYAFEREFGDYSRIFDWIFGYGDALWTYRREQRNTLLFLGIFTLLVMIAKSSSLHHLSKNRGNHHLILAGVLAMACGLLLSAINFFMMSQIICDKDCIMDLLEKAREKHDDPDYAQNQVADDWDQFRVCSILVGAGFLLTLIGYAIKDFATWHARPVQEKNEVKRTCFLSKLVLYVGLLAVTTGWSGAFNWYAALVRKLADGKVVEADKVSGAREDIKNYLIAAGVGFILTALGEGARRVSQPSATSPRNPART